MASHLNLIQGVVNRTENNSFALKALSVTLMAALLAFARSIETTAITICLIGLLPLALFCFLDVRYMALGARYRAFYEHVRSGADVAPFSLSPADYEVRSRSLWGCLASWSVWPVYVTLGLLVLVSAIFE